MRSTGDQAAFQALNDNVSGAAIPVLSLENDVWHVAEAVVQDRFLDRADVPARWNHECHSNDTPYHIAEFLACWPSVLSAL